MSKAGAGELSGREACGCPDGCVLALGAEGVDPMLNGVVCAAAIGAPSNSKAMRKGIRRERTSRLI
jgi:hypothetical protein